MARELLSSDSSDSDEGGAQLDVEDFKVNQNFARKFEHNKKREEKQRRTYALPAAD
jgi:protein KRI1